MPDIYSDKNVTIRFEVCFAKPATSEELEKYSQIATFSAKTVILTKTATGKLRREEFMCSNDLSIKRSRQGHLYMGSMSRKRDKEGPLFDRVYASALFPNSMNSDEKTKKHDSFIEELLAEIQAFWENFEEENKRQKEEQDNAPLPKAAKALLQMGDRRRKKREDLESSDNIVL